jgi:hypothetical protein
MPIPFGQGYVDPESGRVMIQVQDPEPLSDDEGPSDIDEVGSKSPHYLAYHILDSLLEPLAIHGELFAWAQGAGNGRAGLVQCSQGCQRED